MSKLYEYCGNDINIVPMLWRAAFIARICNIVIPEDMTIYSISEKTLKSIKAENYSEALSHLLILFGAGYCDDEMVQLIAPQAMKYRDVIEHTEDFVIDQCELAEEDQVEEKFVKNALMCVINSKKFDEIQEVDFDSARELCESTYTTIRKGFVFPKNMDFIKLLAEVGEPTGELTGEGNERIRTYNSEETLSGFNDEDFDLDKTLAESAENDTMPKMPFCLNLVNVLRIADIYKKPYCAEFIAYAKAEGIPFDGNFSARYAEYVRKNKMQFTISALHKKRDICGEIVNWFDYCNANYADEKIVISENYDITKDIDLSENFTEKDEPTDDELLKKAVDKFMRDNSILENSVIEVFHGDKRTLYLYTGKTLEELDKDNFRKEPFNYNYVWSLIMEWSRLRIIQKRDNSVTIPAEEWSRIDPKDRPFAKRLIEEQYSLKKKQNKMLQKLSELKSSAKQEMDEKSGIKAQQDELKADMQAKKSERADPIVEEE